MPCSIKCPNLKFKSPFVTDRKPIMQHPEIQFSPWRKENAESEIKPNSHIEHAIKLIHFIILLHRLT